MNELRSDGLKQIGITTNGVALTKRRAKRLKDAGLDTANISLDTLEPMKFLVKLFSIIFLFLFIESNYKKGRATVSTNNLQYLFQFAQLRSPSPIIFFEEDLFLTRFC